MMSFSPLNRRWHQSSKSSTLSNKETSTGAKGESLREEMEEAGNRVEICRVGGAFSLLLIALLLSLSLCVCSICSQTWTEHISSNVSVYVNNNSVFHSVSTNQFWCKCLFSRISSQQTCTVSWPKKSITQTTSKRWGSWNTQLRFTDLCSWTHIQTIISLSLCLYSW